MLILISLTDKCLYCNTRCTNVYPGAGWLSEYYDDSDWNNAYVIDTNNHANYYWGIRNDISSEAQWIWTTGWHGQDKTVYCRKTVHGILMLNVYLLACSSGIIPRQSLV